MRFPTESTITIENVTLGVLVSKMHSEEKALLHSHMSIELFACHKNSIKLLTDGLPVVLEAGDIAIVPSKLRHCKQPGDADSHWSSLLFSYKQTGCAHTASFYSVLNLLCASGSIRVIKNVPALCTEILEAENTVNTALPNAAAFHTASLLAKLAHAAGISENQANQAAKTHSRSKNTEAAQSDSSFYIDIKFIESLGLILNSAHTEGTSAKKAAALLFISERQLSRIVKRLYGRTFHEIVTENRLAQAKKLLAETDLSISEIGETVGFKTTFQRAFFKHFGVSPSEYRRLGKEFELRK